MDPSGRQNNVGSNMQEYLRQKEELRRLKAYIEAAERSMDFQMIGEMQPVLAAAQQIGPPVQQIGAPVPYFYPPSSLPVRSLPFPGPTSSAMQETARIIEVDNSSSPQTQPLDLAASKISPERHTTSQALYQEYTQPGPMNSTQRPEPSSALSQAGPSNQNYSQQPQSNMNYTHYGPAQSFIEYNQTPINTYSQGTHHGSTYQTQRDQNHVDNAEFIGPPTSARLQNSFPARASQNGRSAFTARLGSHGQADSQPGSQFQGSSGQRNLTYNEAPVGKPLQYIPSPQLRGSDGRRSQPRMQIVNRSGAVGVRPDPRNTAEYSTSQGSNTSNTRGPIPLSFTIPRGPPQSPSHDGKSYARGNSGESKRITPTSGFEPRRTDQNSPVLPAPSNPMVSATLQLPSSSSTSVDQTNHDIDKLPALSKLTDLLAGHDRWSEDAISRILKDTADSSASKPSHVPSNQVKGGSNGVVDHERGDQKDIEPNGVSSRPPQAPLAQVHSQPHPQASTPSIVGQLSEIIESHNNEFVATPATKPHEHRGQLPLADPLPEHSFVDSSSAPSDTVTSSAPIQHDPPGAVADFTLPRTPVGGSKVSASTPASASADRKTLAKDVIRALLPPSTKRKRGNLEIQDGEDNLAGSPSAKWNKMSTSEDVSESRQMPRGGMLAEGHMPSSRDAPSDSRPGQPITEQATPQQQPVWRARLHTQGVQPYITQSPSGEHFVQSNPYSLSYFSQFSQPLAWQSYPTRGSTTWPAMSQNPRIPPVDPRHSTSMVTSEQTPPNQASQHLELSQHPPLPIKSTASLPPTVVAAKPPLFLPSSESPPASSRHDTPPHTKYHGSQVERTASLPKATPTKPRKTHKVTNVHASIVPGAESSGTLFGAPTGVLAAASITKRAGIRRSNLRAYVLVPQIDTKPWYTSRSSKEKKTTDSRPKKSGAGG